MSLLESVLVRTKKLESLLATKFGADGRGLHEKTSSIEAYLSVSLVKRLRYIASVRNKTVHEDGFVFQGDEQEFLQMCDDTVSELSSYEYVPPPAQPTLDHGRKALPSSTSSWSGAFIGCLIIPAILVVFSFIGGVKYVRTNLQQAKSPQASKLISFSPQVLDTYTGQFKSKSMSVTISRKENHLYLKSSKFSSELLAKSDLNFEGVSPGDGIRWEITFGKDKQGNIAYLMIKDIHGQTEKVMRIK